MMDVQIIYPKWVMMCEVLLGVSSIHSTEIPRRHFELFGHPCGLLDKVSLIRQLLEIFSSFN